MNFESVPIIPTKPTLATVPGFVMGLDYPTVPTEATVVSEMVMLHLRRPLVFHPDRLSKLN